MRNEILTSVYSYFHYKQKNDASLELIERIILEKDFRQVISVLLEILKEINHIDNYSESAILYKEYLEFGVLFSRHIKDIMDYYYLFSDEIDFDD